MSRQDVIRAIEQVRSYVLEFEESLDSETIYPEAPANNHETSTRYIIIDPILRSLGWDLSNPKQCVVEYRTAHGFVDYALLNKSGHPVILIEAKRIDVHTEDEENWEQIEDYCEAVRTVRVAVVTNGQYWAIEFKDMRNEWMAESDYPLGLHYRNTEANAARLCKFLDRSNYW